MKSNGSAALPEAMPVEIASLKRKVAALHRLGVSQKEFDAAPQITPILKSSTDGGLKGALRAMRFAQDEVIAAFLAKYDSVPARDRDSLPLEAIALAAGVDLKNLLGSIMFAIQAQAVNAVKILAMSNHHRITRARIKFGQLPGGERDRTALDTAMGFLPSPKGPTFIGKAIFGSGRSVMDAQGALGAGEDDDETLAAENDPDLDRLFPPANAMQEKLTPIRQRMLPG